MAKLSSPSTIQQLKVPEREDLKRKRKSKTVRSRRTQHEEQILAAAYNSKHPRKGGGVAVSPKARVYNSGHERKPRKAELFEQDDAVRRPTSFVPYEPIRCLPSSTPMARWERLPQGDPMLFEEGIRASQLPIYDLPDSKAILGGGLTGLEKEYISFDDGGQDVLKYDDTDEDELSGPPTNHKRLGGPPKDEGYSSFRIQSVSSGATQKWAPDNFAVPPGTKKFYAVRKGRRTGVFFCWEGRGGAEELVNGFSGALFKSFKRLEDALDFLGEVSPIPQALAVQLQPIPAKPTAAGNGSLDTANDGPPLCEEQQKLVNLVLSGKNVFFTGAAGTGKSTVLRAFVKELEKQGKRVTKVTPTGIAALNIGGQTYFTFAGWTVDSKKSSLKKLMDEATVGIRWSRLNETDVLVIDEISMIEAFQFERLDRACRAARSAAVDKGNNSYCHGDRARTPHDDKLPFGGMQVIVTGDFRQLPPVRPFANCWECGKAFSRNKPRFCEKCKSDFSRHSAYAFASIAWDLCKFSCFQLTQPHRQAELPLLNILSALREDLPLADSQIDVLLNHESDTTDGMHLFATNKDAELLNNQELEKLDGPEVVFGCHDDFSWNIEIHHELAYFQKPDNEGPHGCLYHLRDHRLERWLKMKKDMLVMLVSNIDTRTGLVNGTQGKIVDFREYDSNHLSPNAEPGSTNFLPSATGAHGEYRDARIRSWISKASKKLWPVVRFLDGRERAIYPVCQVQTVGDDDDEKAYSLLSRTNIPLVPAWAITIHKSQGISLDRVIVHLDAAFEREMAYVALSRARRLGGLKVVSENRLEVLRPLGKLASGNPVVAAFHRACFGAPKLLS